MEKILQSNHYGANSIVILSGLEAVRRNPGMYIGSTDINGLHHLAKEVIDNAIDEAACGYCSEIKVCINNDGTCSIEDNGRGIPTDIYPGTDKSSCEIILTTLHSGSKFHNVVYNKPTGLHGVGLSCVNALSQKLTLEINRNNHLYKQEYAYGNPLSSLTKIADSSTTGTKITFLPDHEIFGEEIYFSTEILCRRLNELAFLNRGLIIKLDNQRTNESYCYQYDTGLLGLLDNLCKNTEKIHDEPLFLEYKDAELEFECALQWTKNHEEKVLTYVNNVNTTYGGQHAIALQKALTDVINDFAVQNKLIAGDSHIRLLPPDVYDGLIIILAIRINNPLYEGQTKIKLTNKEIYGKLYPILYKSFLNLLSHHSKLATLIINKSLSSYKARIAAWQAAEIVVYQNQEIKISKEVYQKQFGVRSKNWHDSAKWITDENLLKTQAATLQLDDDAIMLDVCCGSGVVGAAFKHKVKKAIGLDLTPEMVNLAKERLDEVHQGNIYDMPFPDNTFDLVVTREVFHLFPNPEKPMSEIFRVLKNNGQFIFSQIVPFSNEDCPWMFRIFKKKQPLLFNMYLEEDYRKLLLETGFCDIKTSEINVWESIDTWINTHETTTLHRHEIKELFYKAPKTVRDIHPFKILPDGEVHDLWRWVIFSVKKITV